MARMPTIEEVIAYANPICRNFIGKLAADSPPEHHDEILQTLAVRLLELYPKIQPDGGWKSLVYNHARGTVLDYLKFGKGFEESNWSLQNYKDGNTPKLTRRVVGHSADADDDAFDIDQTLGSHGVFNELDLDRVDIKWDLLAKMCSKDENLHAFAKFIRGISVEDMAPVFGLCRTRVSQMIQVFLDRFDDPEQADDPWFKQICFALGVCKHLGMPDIDQATCTHWQWAGGYKLDPVDLDSVKPHQYLIELDAQLEMKLDEQEEAQNG